MKTSFDIVTDVISLINVPAVTHNLDGKIWPFVRPDNREKVDITVGLLAGTNEWLQEAIVNIRIHASDFYTFNSVSQIILPLVESQYRDTFYTEVDNSGKLITNPDGTRFFRIRVHYYSIQSNYKKI